MGIFSRRKPQVDRAALTAQLEELKARPRSPETDHEMRRIRHLIGADVLASPPDRPEYVAPASTAPARGAESKLPEATLEEFTPELLRAAILDGGCLLVRGAVPEDEAKSLAEGIERSFAARASLGNGASDPDGFYDELEPEDSFEVNDRDWIEQGGGVLAGDSPRLLADMLGSFDRIGLPQVIAGYLGEKPLISADKSTLRKATPDVGGAWHQDGKFMGEVSAMNVWLALSRCGDEAPGMDLVPRRLEDYVPTGTEGAWLADQVADAAAVEAAGDAGVVRPIFNPGDVLLFDELFLHSTASDPAMTKPRYAIESWFFGPSAFPDIYVPLAV